MDRANPYTKRTPVSLEDLGNDLWRISTDTNGYLICRPKGAILVDCPPGPIAEALKAAGLPEPRTILHTQVQAEHCGEWESFPTASIFVPKGREDLANVSSRFVAAKTAVWGPERDWESRGAEEFGIAGCITARPPDQPLHVTGMLVPGTTFTWNDIDLEVISLPGSDGTAVGLYWRSAGVLFSGDLLRAGGWCVNLYDIERCYGIPTGYTELRSSLESVKTLNPKVLYPSTGPIITNPAADIESCLSRTAWVSSPPVRRADRAYALTNYTPARTFGNYREVMPRVYQQTNYGNIIVYIQPSGDAILIDPGPCYWKPTWDETRAVMNEDLDILEREAGLQRVVAVLATHYHGDHVECLDLVRDRYSAPFMATPDVAAVLARPNDFPYPCRVPWYGFPFDTLDIDVILPYDKTVFLGGMSVTPIHLPGHCRAHSGFVIPWMGELTIATGDVIQYGDGPISFGLPIIYNDAGSPSLTTAEACRTLSKWRPTVLIGGHSHSCKDPDGQILADCLAVAEAADEKLASMVPPGAWEGTTTPPGFAELRA